MTQRQKRQGLAVAGVFVFGMLAGIPLSGCATRTKTERPQSVTRTDTRPAGERSLLAGQRAVAEGDTERALAEFQRAIDVNPELTAAHLAMGDLFRMQGAYERAESAYRRAAQIDPKNFASQYYDGLMLHLLNRVGEAIQAYLRALSIDASDFRTNLNLGQAYYQIDENGQALRYAQRAVEIDPRDGAARFSLGAIYAALGRHREAVQEYQQAAELMALSPKLLLKLAESLGQLQRWEEMANALEQVIKTEPSPAAYERMGVARFRMEQYDVALSHFQKALSLDADYYPALNGQGVCMLNKWLFSGKQDHAAYQAGVDSLRRSVQIKRDQSEVIDLLSRYGR
jgi:tetratricopeptide (TPR) repeat protein